MLKLTCRVHNFIGSFIYGNTDIFINRSAEGVVDIDDKFVACLRYRTLANIQLAVRYFGQISASNFKFISTQNRKCVDSFVLQDILIMFNCKSLFKKRNDREELLLF